MKITISHCEVTLTAEIPEGSDIGQTLRAIRVLLVGVGFHSDLINQFCGMTCHGKTSSPAKSFHYAE